MPFTTRDQGALRYLTAPQLARCPQITHGFSTRLGGVSMPPFDTLNLGVGRGDDRAAVAENYRRFCTALGVDPHRCVLSKQVHEDTVRVVEDQDAGKGLLLPRDYTADALVTDRPGLALVVFSADCGILLFHDPVTGCVGACHAGWRGCAKGIVKKTVETMTARYGAKPEDLRCAIGPCISQAHFETDGDVPAAMETALGDDATSYLARQGEKWHVDLSGLNRQWLLRAGVNPAHIDLGDLCSFSRADLFWSHRRDGQARGAQVALIALRPGKKEDAQ